MADENIPEKIYSELKYPVCPKCEDKLTMDDPGVWYCENDNCAYTEYNNITECRSDFGCDNLVMCKDLNFNTLEDQYCQVESKESPRCLDVARNESDMNEHEHLKIMDHIKGCNDPDCECRNY